MMWTSDWVIKNHPREAEKHLREAAESGAPIDDCIRYFGKCMRNYLVRDLQAIDREMPKTEGAEAALWLLKDTLYDELEQPFATYRDYVWDNIRKYGYHSKKNYVLPEVEWIPYEWDIPIDEYVERDTAEYQLEAVKKFVRDNPDAVKSDNFLYQIESVAGSAIIAFYRNVYVPIIRSIAPELEQFLAYDGLWDFVCQPVYDYAERVQREYMDNARPNRNLGAANRTKTARAAPRETVHSTLKASKAAGRPKARSSAKTGSRSVKSKTASKSVRTKTAAKKTTSKKPASKSVKSKAAGTGRRSR